MCNNTVTEHKHLFFSFSSLFQHQIRWHQALQLNTPATSGGDIVPPVSVCSQPCEVGHQAVVTQPSCCFYCEACRENERTVMYGNLPKCERCPTSNSFTWPDDETRTTCLPIPPTFLHITQLEGILLLTLDILVFVVSCATTFFYIKNGLSLDIYIKLLYADVHPSARRNTYKVDDRTRSVCRKVHITCVTMIFVFSTDLLIR